MPQADASRFFLRLLKATAIEEPTCREDFLTECLAATLAEDEALARRFALFIAGPEVEGTSVALARIGVETQVSFPGSCLDLVLRLDGTVAVAVEIKLDAPEGEGQLAKYLKLPGIHRVAFLAPGRRTIDPSVLAHPHYLRPANGQEHFTWRDLYAPIAAPETALPARSTLRQALLGLLEYLGFEPPHPELGDLHAEDEQERIRHRRNAAKHLDDAREVLVSQGWRLDPFHPPGDVWTVRQQVGRLSQVWLSTCAERGMFKVRFYFASEAERAAVAAELATLLVTEAIPGAGEVTISPVKRVEKSDGSTVWATDVLTPHQAILANRGTETIGACWARHVGLLAACASRRAP